MAITTLNKVNTILGLSGQDDLVNSLIPLVEEEYLNIRNRPFDIAQVITVTAPCDTTNSLEILIGDVYYYVDLKELDTEEIIARKIYHAFRHTYSVKQSGATVTLSNLEGFLSISDSITGAEFTVSGPDTIYPIGAEMTAIQMIGYRIAKQSSQGIASESLGDHSVSYEQTAGGVEYPKSITGSIKRFVDFI